MNVLIIENEAPAVENLLRLLKNSGEDYHVLGILETVEASVNWLMKKPPVDLIFMDVQLDDGICFEIFETCTTDIPVIFTTAYDEYAIRAFEVNSVDYLLKPVSLEAFNRALHKYNTRILRPEDRQRLMSHWLGNYEKQFKMRFFVKAGSRYKSIPVCEIAFFSVEEGDTFLTTKEGRSYDIEYSLDQLEKIINPSEFFRLNRSYLVSMNCLGDIVRLSPGKVKVSLITATGKTEIFVSRERMNAFRKWLDQ